MYKIGIASKKYLMLCETMIGYYVNITLGKLQNSQLTSVQFWRRKSYQTQAFNNQIQIFQPIV